ncbi:MAG TPA: FAD-binding oxidoreductase [Candidatus Binataceae bacterium]|nr:FAD-binding oxidoreductase [Candidatus Binataceae bacterium]
MAERKQFEVVIVGGGIAGASLAYFLTERGVTDIAVLERESQHGYHSTGRSAATLVEKDPIAPVQQLKALGGKFLRNPPPGFSDNALLNPCPVMILYRRQQIPATDAAIETLRRDRIAHDALSSAEAMERLPVLTLEGADRVIVLTACGRIDVHELLTSYLRHARSRGAVIRTSCEVREVVVEGGRCNGVITDGGTMSARWVVDAAGAWAGVVAQKAGAIDIRMEPRRRTIVTFAPPAGMSVSRWPFVISEADQIYFAPESGGLMLSPMDQEPIAPCDAQPDDEVIAAAMERLRALAPSIMPHALKRKWSGLRTFSPDSIPVVGEDPRVKGFFWLAGQQGFGIESSPAMGQIAADLLVRGKTESFDASILSPLRFEK